MRRAFTIPELIGIVVVIAVVAVLVLPLVGPRPPRHAKILKDAVHLKQVHQAWMVYAQGNDDLLPAPGQVRRRPTLIAGREEFVPGVGTEAIELNTTANLHAMLIMQNYYSPDLCVGPSEPSPNVAVKDDYDWEAYDPVRGIHWDPSFAADLDATSNVSYASTPIVGTRRHRQWKLNRGATFAVASNRGPKDGVDDRKSRTYQIHDPKKSWRGNVVYNDNHTQVHDTMTPLTFVVNGQTFPDNLFAQDQPTDFGQATDTFVAIVSELELAPDDDNTISGWTLEWD